MIIEKRKRALTREREGKQRVRSARREEREQRQRESRESRKSREKREKRGEREEERRGERGEKERERREQRGERRERESMRKFVKKGKNFDLNVNVSKSQCDSSKCHGGPSAPGELVVVASIGDEWLRMVATSCVEWPRWTQKKTLTWKSPWCLGCLLPAHRSLVFLFDAIMLVILHKYIAGLV